jgi:hypothetical protein
MKDFKLIIAVAIMAALMTTISCAGKTAVSTTYASLETAETIYFAGLGIAEDLYKQGKLSPDCLLELKYAKDAFQSAHYIASTALLVYKSDPSIKSAEELQEALDECLSCAFEFKRLINLATEGGYGKAI